MARALHAAGFRAGDLVHNTFSYHLTPAGAMLELARRCALGCPVIPAGTGQTEQQLRTIADLRPVAYVGTPSFLKILIDRAAETGSNIASLTKAMVGAEAFPAVLRVEFKARDIAALSLGRCRSWPVAIREPRARRSAVREAWCSTKVIKVQLRQHERPSPRARSARWWSHHADPGISADPVHVSGDLSGDIAEAELRAGAPTSGSAAGSAVPIRPRRCAACSSTPCRSPRSPAGTNRSSAPGW